MSQIPMNHYTCNVYAIHGNLIRMYIFSLTVAVFLFLAYHFIAFEQRPVLLRWFLWGIVFCIPGLLLRSWFMFLYPNFWGSVFLIYSFGMAFFIVPIALSMGGIALTLRIQHKTIPETHEIEAFQLGWAALYLCAHSIVYWGKLYWVYALAIPLLYLCTVHITIPLIELCFRESFPETLRPLFAILGIALGAGLITSLPFFGFGIVTVILTAVAVVGSVFLWVKWHPALVSRSL